MHPPDHRARDQSGATGNLGEKIERAIKLIRSGSDEEKRAKALAFLERAADQGHEEAASYLRRAKRSERSQAETRRKRPARKRKKMIGRVVVSIASILSLVIIIISLMAYADRFTTRASLVIQGDLETVEDDYGRTCTVPMDKIQKNPNFMAKLVGRVTRISREDDRFIRRLYLPPDWNKASVRSRDN